MRLYAAVQLDETIINNFRWFTPKTTSQCCFVGPRTCISRSPLLGASTKRAAADPRASTAAGMFPAPRWKRIDPAAVFYGKWPRGNLHIYR